MTYAYDATGFVDPFAAHNAGYVTAIRYLDGGKPTPTPAEIDAYWSAGVAVAFVFETDGNAARRGYAGGADDVRVAEAVAATVGLPTDRPIFYAPWDHNSDAGAAEDDYWRAVAVSSTRPTFGAYGNVHTLTRAGRHDACRYLWAVETWGVPADWRLVLVQLANTPGPPIAGVPPSAYDPDDVRALDHGQWPSPAPPPATTPRPGVHPMTVCWIDFHGIIAYLVQAGIIVHEFTGAHDPTFGLPADALAFAHDTSCGVVNITGAEWQSLLHRSGIH